jgi:4-hydroxybenzoate polyprenyltransferase
MKNTFIAKLRIWSEMVKLEHTIFSAPFMLASMLLAAEPVWPKLKTFFWCAVALLGARSAAMSLNRSIDAKIDALNPRTSNRAIPAGKLSVKIVFWLALISFALLALAALNLPPLCLYLLPVAVFWLSLYSYCKRFTWLAHFVLGVALGGAALGGWIAVTGSISLSPVIFALGVAFWVSGFDILYALQDQDFDLTQKLHSVPARFGLDTALWVSRVSHLFAVAFFAWAGLSFKMGPGLTFGYWSGAFSLVLGLVVQHWLIIKDLTKIELVFFMANAWISSLFFICLFMGKLFGAIFL